MNKAGISLILKIEEAGDEIKTEIYDNFNQANGPDPKLKGGRPILMHLTNKKYLFISMHGAQNAGLGKYKKQFNEYMVENNKEELEKKVSEFLNDDKVKESLGETGLKAIYVMGDFNDRYDAITEFDFDGKKLTYKESSPASCCYNYNSMSKHEEKIKIYADETETEEVETYQGKDDEITKKAHTDAKGIITEDHGINIEHYLNKGDKVFAWPRDGPLRIFKGSDEEKMKTYSKNPSDKSDHELVYMFISPEIKGRRDKDKPEYFDVKRAAVTDRSAEKPAPGATETEGDKSAKETEGDKSATETEADASSVTPADTTTKHPEQEGKPVDTAKDTSATDTAKDTTKAKEGEETGGLFGGFFGGKKKTKKRKSSKKKTKKKRKGKRKGGTKKLNTTHKK